MNVLVIPEDFRKDQYILKPIFEAIMSYHGRRSTTVLICNPPLLQGVTEALKSSRLQEIVDRYAAMVDLFVLCVDRDGQVGRKSRLSQIEAEFSPTKPFLAENAWEEIETWVLAGLTLPREWRWRDIRGEVSVKERYFEPISQQMEVADGPGGGRKALGVLAARNIAGILAKCPDDLARLSERIKQHLS